MDREPTQGEVIVRHRWQPWKPPIAYQIERGPELVPGMGERLARYDHDSAQTLEEWAAQAEQRQQARQKELPVILFNLLLLTGVLLWLERHFLGHTLTEGLRNLLPLWLFLLFEFKQWLADEPPAPSWAHRVGTLTHKERRAHDLSFATPHDALRLVFDGQRRAALTVNSSLWEAVEVGQQYEYYFDPKKKTLLAIAPARHVQALTSAVPDLPPPPDPR